MTATGKPPISLGDQLRALRRASGLTQEEFAHRSGLSHRSVSDIERGHTRSPRADTVAQIADGLGLTGSERQRFIRSLPRRTHTRRTGTSERATDVAPNHAPSELDLPIQSRMLETVGPLIGRQHEVDAAVATLSTGERLLTVTGPPGVGKTRFTVELARQAAIAELVDATAFVSLDSARTRSEAIGLITTTLGISVTAPPSSMAVLGDFLRQHRVLLVLDNLEQIEEGRSLLGDLNTGVSRSLVVTTSRHALTLRRGQEISLAPLALPESGNGADLTTLREVPSVRFLLDRLQRSGSPLALTAANAAVLIDLCRAIDGLPLALEIVAARLRSTPPDHLLAQLRDCGSLPLLGPEDAPDRQRSLRAAIAWSVDLLAPEVRDVLARVAIFTGGFTANAARAVAGPQAAPGSPPFDPNGIVPMLSDLVDKHLLVLDPAQPDGDPAEAGGRYRLLETIRDYGLHLLAESGHQRATRDAQARWCADVVERADLALSGQHPDRWLRRLDLELANIRAAFEWQTHRAAAGDSLAVEGCLNLSARLWHYWRVRGLSDEGIQRIETALKLDAQHRGAARSLARARALNNLGILVMDSGDSLRTRSLYETSLAMSRAIGDGRGIADTVNNLGVLAVYHGNYVEAQRYHEESYWLRLPLGDSQRMIVSLQNLGDIALDLELHDLAIAFHAEGLQLARRVGDRSSVAYGWQSMGELLTDFGHVSRARRYLADARAAFETIGDQLGLGFVAHTWGCLSARENNQRTALAWQQRALTYWRQANNRRGQVAAIEAAAMVLYLLGRYPVAATLLDNAQRVRTEEHMGRPPKRTMAVERTIERLHRDHPDAIGQQPGAIPLDELVTLTIRLEAVVRPRPIDRRVPRRPSRSALRSSHARPSAPRGT